MKTKGSVNLFDICGLGIIYENILQYNTVILLLHIHSKKGTVM